MLAMQRRWCQGVLALIMIPAASLTAIAQPTVVQRTTDTARVIRVKALPGPQIERRICRPVSVERHYDSSPGGAILGGLAGAAIGSRFGGGHGRDAATVAGAIGGAMIGNRAGRGSRIETREECDTVYEPGEPEGYDVTYEYQGVRRNVTLSYDPGDELRVHKVVSVE